jgi:hypothetical protein
MVKPVIPEPDTSEGEIAAELCVSVVDEVEVVTDIASRNVTVESVEVIPLEFKDLVVDKLEGKTIDWSVVWMVSSCVAILSLVGTMLGMSYGLRACHCYNELRVKVYEQHHHHCQYDGSRYGK